MKRLLCLWLLLFVFTACIPSSGFAIDNRYAVSQAISSSVSIQTGDGWFGWHTIGSGTIVRQHNALYMGPEPKFAILTAQHVMDLSTEDVVRACSDVDPSVCVSLGSYTYGDAPYATVSGNDWALAFIHKLEYPMKPARVRLYALALGERVIIIGHPWREFLIAEGICGSKGWRQGAMMDRITSYGAPGSSGGGVFDKRGRLVGIVSGIAVQEDYNDIPGYQHPIVYTVPVGNVVW